MKLSRAPSIAKRKKRRLGQGFGSGRGKTGGRGTKGQTSRGKMPLAFEGGQAQLIKRLPFLRGKEKNASSKKKAFPIPVSKLEIFDTDTTVTPDLLVDKGLLKDMTTRVKFLGGGLLTKKLTVVIDCSKSAKKVIEDAGGTVISA